MGPAWWNISPIFLLVALTFHMGIGLCPGSSAFDPALCCGLGEQQRAAKSLGTFNIAIPDRLHCSISVTVTFSCNESLDWFGQLWPTGLPGSLASFQ